MVNFVPMDLKMHCPNDEINFRPRSDTMLVGMLWCFHTLSMKRQATPSSVTFFVVETKWHRLANLSTTTQMESNPRSGLGKSVMKSMDIDCHLSSGILSGSRRPGDFSIFHQYQPRARAKYVRSAPGWPP
ncbi:hypothetical protein PHPALM_30890 [Phytophthora palmivora]|uniref:Uncharacterized protein n=1 Tax=Phytophthora palmivora TaxID=4796 RepID=A0A2P4X412_9STRA|nr:hypothetical protein PHPALM_30890 [Phytophthora palmivora]